MKTWQTEYLEMIDKCVMSEEMSDWEKAFTDSLRIQLQIVRTITPKQIEKLEDILTRCEDKERRKQ